MRERTRIAMELHDTLLQSFSGAVMQLEALAATIAASSPAAERALTAIIAQTRATLGETRQLIWNLRTPERDARGLSEALALAARSIDGGATQLRYAERGAPVGLVPVALSAMLRIGREAVSNAVKHADARTVDIELAYEARAVHLTVCDDGRGTDLGTLDGARTFGHWGVADMRTRASDAGGELRIVSRPGEGTRVALSVPVLAGG